LHKENGYAAEIEADLLDLLDLYGGIFVETEF